MSDNATYDRLISLLDVSGVDHRLIDHESEGTTEIVSALRGHPSVQAAKCLVLIVKVDRRTTRYVPGDRRVDLRCPPIVNRTSISTSNVPACSGGSLVEMLRVVVGELLQSGS
jgi:Ala-tRNA(Pro) deacylase